MRGPGERVGAVGLLDADLGGFAKGVTVLCLADGKADRFGLIVAVGKELALFVNHIPTIIRGVVINMKAVVARSGCGSGQEILPEE